jgi:hypothetical protein
MRFGRHWCTVVCAAMLGLASTSRAAIVIDTTSSTLDAIAADGTHGNTTDDQSTGVTQTPFVGSVTATQGTATSTVGANLTQSAFAFTVSQFNPALGGSAQTVGVGDINFTPGSDMSFTFTASFATLAGVIGVNLPGEAPAALLPVHLDASLFDVTTSTSVFDLHSSGVVGDTLTLPTQTGALHGGDAYEFFFIADINGVTDPSGTGTVTLAFKPNDNGGGGGTPVPLPAAAWLAVLAVPVLGLFGTRRKVGLSA